MQLKFYLIDYMRNRFLKFTYLVLILVLLAGFLLYNSTLAGYSNNYSKYKQYQKEIEDLKKQLEFKKKSIDQLKKEVLLYEANIKARQKQAISLQNQLEIIKDKISKILLEIDIKNQEIEKNKKEIKNLEHEINLIEQKIKKNKKSLEVYIKILNEKDNKNLIHILATKPTFSEFFNEIQYIQNLQKDVSETLKNIKHLKISLENKRKILLNKNDKLVEDKLELEKKNNELKEEQALQEYYLRETRLSEAKFQRLLVRLKKEQASIEQEIVSYEKAIRKKLQYLEQLKKKKQGVKSDSIKLGKGNFIWPVDPSRGITTEFYDPHYPFRYLFEHAALDIRAPVGTPIRAAESGYVARTYLKGRKFGYVMLIHGNGISTLYGHVSKILVQEGSYVNKGDIIALSGGMPGMIGSGLSTGPHLHLEFRLNGIPVNPRLYLPKTN